MYPVGDVGVVLDETGLGGLIIIRSDDEQAIDAAGLCVQGQIQGGHGAVAAGAGDDLDPVIHLLDAVFDGSLVLLDGLGGGFAGGSEDEEGIDMPRELCMNQTLHCRMIGRSAAKRRNQRRCSSSENRISG